jgi:lipopolysaccharide/colanic/teichoic acid biosynthesis glycosyltransferase
MLLDWVRQFAGWGGGPAGDPEGARLPSRGQFLRLMQRERARADRAGSQFSLLVLGADRAPGGAWSGHGRATLHHLLRLLRRRLRVTDDVGWLDRRHLGVILPDTPAWGAWSLVDDLCLAFPTDIPLFHCKVYVYPAEGPEADDGAADGVADRTARTQPPGAGPYPAQPVEPFFVERLPAWKRGLDIAGATCALVVLAPVLLLVAAAIKLSSRGPVLFVQWRRGLGGRPFRLYKFRSMVADAEARKAEVLALNERDGPVFKIEQDPRVTRLGRWLRKTSLDELPQLWNVLRGDMSLVGPRPLPLTEADGCRGWYRHRTDVTPGITCFWQVRGPRDVPFVEWMRMDARYPRSRSLLGDLLLLLKTVPAVLLRRNQ